MKIAVSLATGIINYFLFRIPGLLCEVDVGCTVQYAKNYFREVYSRNKNSYLPYHSTSGRKAHDLLDAKKKENCITFATGSISY